MARNHIVTDVTTGLTTVVPYTAQEEIDADAAKAADDLAQAPIIAEQVRRAALKGNARAVVLINALTTKDDVALNAAVTARYPGLTGDALKAVQDIALVLAYQYHNGG